ncbi:phosphoribosyltransferase family protein [Paenibacillus sp. 481]|nr:phosphoribosyltransferase family protein [Paenibacillus sp. 481]
MAARVNKKRSFLFVSKVLGKHIPVDPCTSLLSGASLALLYQQELGGVVPLEVEGMLKAFQDPAYAQETYRQLKRTPMQLTERTLFIGFAETATALGHSMYDMFSGPVHYLHTTREHVAELETVITFEEEHSHATDHRCYALDPDSFERADTVVLVDDEMTTGKTSLNIIKALHARFKHKRFFVASLLDWRNVADRQAFADLERELDVTITCLSLVQGEIEVTGGPIERLMGGEEQGSVQGLAKGSTVMVAHGATQASAHDAAQDGAPALGENQEHVQNRVHFETYRIETIFDRLEATAKPYLRHTGRFGLFAAQNARLDEHISATAQKLRTLRNGARTLCMGTGEFMYVPMRIAAEMGQDVVYQSTTRSPIHPYVSDTYAVRYKANYPSLEDPEVQNFMYNIPADTYDDMFLFIECEPSAERLEPLMEVLSQLRIPRINIVYFS